MDQLISKLLDLGWFGIAAFAIGWVVKSVITSSLESQVAATKIKLAADYENALEQLKSSLSRQAFEHEVKYRRVDEKVAERLDGSYQRLLKLFESVSKLVAILEYSGGPTKEELLERCQKANKEFGEYFYDNRCYIPPALFTHIKKVADDLVSVANDFARGMRHERHGTHYRRVDFWGEAFDAVKDEINPLFSVIIRAVQRRLGVEDSPMELEELAKVPNNPRVKKLRPQVEPEEGEQVEDDDDDWDDEDNVTQYADPDDEESSPQPKSVAAEGKSESALKAEGNGEKKANQ